MTVIAVSDAFEQYKQQIEELNRIIVVNDGHIIINVHYEYSIPLSRCCTHEDILGWVFQLSEKTWMSREILRHFMRIAHSVNKLDIPHP
ncbi:hypothetical protein [Plasticicumulans sp.]|uniref:hypothetical protein n=1 Tax=Plasticicumulans sp. TaxID=2307179 RepID=UPI002C4FDDD3|nr:hypothetical protein [Plasticicumulans sp.]HNM42807.1 hypothetical protein [Plasticicumulans sp.]